MWEILSEEDVEAIRWGSLDANTFEGPEEYAERREMQRHLRSAIAELTEGQRYAVSASFGIDGKGERTCKQIAAELDNRICAGRVNQHIHRAMQKLKYSKRELYRHVLPPAIKRERKAEVWVHIEDIRKQREAERRNNEKWRLHWERERRMVEAQKAAAAQAARAKAMDAESDRWAKLRQRWAEESGPAPPSVPLEPWAEKLKQHMSATYVTECIEHWHERVALAERAKLFGRSIDAQYKLELRERWHTMTYTAGRVMKGR